MLEYCLCPKCERMIMLDADYPSGFCLYCGTHISYAEAKEDFLSGLRSAIPDELVLEADLSELIDEDGWGEDAHGLSDCRSERDQAQEYMGKWDFAKAYEHYTKALEWYPSDFESSCGRLTSGILKLNDVENWESRLLDCLSLIRSQGDWGMAQKALEYALDILRKFLSKGGRFVAPSYTYGFFKKVMESFPALRKNAVEIFAHCLNTDNAPFTDAARLDHETTRFAVGSFNSAPDKDLRHPLALVMKYHGDARVKENLCRALYVYDRAVWLQNRDTARIEDIIGFLELIDGQYTDEDKRIARAVCYDFLMMGGMEHNTTPREKQIFLMRVYTLPQMKRMDRYFGDDQFFNRLYAEIYRKQNPSGVLSAEYKRITAKLG